MNGLSLERTSFSRILDMVCKLDIGRKLSRTDTSIPVMSIVTVPLTNFLFLFYCTALLFNFQVKIFKFRAPAAKRERVL